MGIGSSFIGGYNAATDARKLALMGIRNAPQSAGAFSPAGIPNFGRTPMGRAANSAGRGVTPLPGGAAPEEKEEDPNAGYWENRFNQLALDTGRQKMALAGQKAETDRDLAEADIEATKANTKATEAAMQFTKRAESRREAFRQIMQGLAMRDSAVVKTGFQNLAPTADIVPGVSFNGDGSIDAMFPGQDQPARFGNVDQFFKSVVAPLNPAAEQRKDAKGGQSDLEKSARFLAEAKGIPVGQAADLLRKDKTLSERVRGYEQYVANRLEMIPNNADWDLYAARVRREAANRFGLNEDMGYGRKPMQPGAQATEDTPPVEGAKKAKDGNWYVQKDGKYYRVRKPLDKDTARAILKEAGGDKDKARQIAAQRGYDLGGEGTTAARGKGEPLNGVVALRDALSSESSIPAASWNKNRPKGKDDDDKDKKKKKRD